MRTLTSTKIIIFAFILVFFNACGNSMVLLFEEPASDTRAINVTYNVTYDANTGSGIVPADTNDYIEGASVTVLNHGTLTRWGGYTFDCWNTQADGNGSDLAEGSTFTMGQSDVTLYAKWKPETIILNETTEQSEIVQTAVLDNQDRLLIGGRIENANWDAAIWRYNLDGTPDTSFGTNGVVSWNSPENNTDFVYCIKVKPDGAILLGGISYDSSGAWNAFLGRLLPDGQPDTGLSPDGFKYVDIDPGKVNTRVSLTFDSQDRLLFSGITTLIRPFVVGIARITTSGIIDTTFSNMGYFTPPRPAIYNYEGGIIVDSGYIYKVVMLHDGTSKIYKLNESDGSQVDLIEDIQIKAYHGIAIHGDYLYFAGYHLSPDRFGWAKINKTDFSYDLTYGNNGIGDGSPQSDGGRANHINVNTNGEAYLGGMGPWGQDGMIIKSNTSGSIDTSWGTSGAFSYVSVGGVDGQIEYVKSTVFHDDKIFIFGHTVVDVNGTLYNKNFFHYTDQ